MQETQNLIHEILPVGMLQCNCHIVGDPQTREAIVIDPGDNAPKILDVINRHHLKVTAIVVTHTHIDHVVGLRRVHEATGAPVYVHADDLDLYRMLEAQASWLGWKTPETAKIDQLVREGDVIRWGGFHAEILHTPGTLREACACTCRRMSRPKRTPLAQRSPRRVNAGPDDCSPETHYSRAASAAPISGAARLKESFVR